MPQPSFSPDGATTCGIGISRSPWMATENASITVVRIGDDGATIVTANDCHLLNDPVLAGRAIP